jgi:deoxyribodipyrimidine photolyase-related protein
MSKVCEIRLILGDQLNRRHSWFQSCRPDVLYVMMECRSETDYCQHHIQKVVAFFIAMRSFSEWVAANGHSIRYISLDDAHNRHSITANLGRLLSEYPGAQFSFQQPDEYRLDQEIRLWMHLNNIAVHWTDTEHFFTHRNEVSAFFSGRKTWRMEYFYRHMRRTHQVLMQAEQPQGGEWNFDAENRKSIPAAVSIPELPMPEHQTEGWGDWLTRQGVITVGVLPEKLMWPTTPDEARYILEHFIEKMLPSFGRYQDALTQRHDFLFHSRLSFALNAKLISPAEVVQAAEQAWLSDPCLYPLASVEGFIRQILGWREYVRGVYWAHMPEYGVLNNLGHHRTLPSWYWTGQTHMACMGHAIGQTLQQAYAHHIQRLMITGNFALLAGIHPDEVDRWYLGVYIDAVEWVEMPNTRGMSQYADGGLMASKPYVSSGQYIRRMGDYCGSCRYKADLSTGPDSCPFNSLYWHFHDRHERLLRSNVRLAMVYRNWDRMDVGKREAVLNTAEAFLERIELL